MNEDTDIDQLDIKESFYLLQQYLNHIGEKDEDDQELYVNLPEIYKKARYGIKLKFDLYDYLNQAITIKQKTGKIQYRNENFDMSAFWTELEERNILMKKWLIDNQPETKTITAYPLPK